MHTASLIVELIRSRPRLVVWTLTIIQAALWFLIPSLFYAAPPGELPRVLAIGREFQLGTNFGPPLAYWLAEIAFRLAFNSVVGVYALAQACIIVTYWALFALGREIVGPRHAALAVVLTVGILVFTIGSPEFGPALLAAPVWALILLHYWRAAGQGRRIYWYAIGFEFGLLLLTTYLGFLLLILLLVYTAATARGRAAISHIEPWAAGVITVLVVFPHLIWFDEAREVLNLAALSGGEAPDRVSAVVRIGGALLLAHAGLILLLVLAGTPAHIRQADAAGIDRPPMDPFAKLFVYYFAVVPAWAVLLFLTILGRAGLLVGAAPLVVFSGLAVVVAARERIRIHHQRGVASLWFALLVLPPLGAIAAVTVLPWVFPLDLRITLPARDMGQFFGENFQRRTGRPLAVVAGEPRLSELIALAAPSRPSLLLQATPERTHWVTPQTLADKGAVVVWTAADTTGTPPPEIRARFPDLVPELPHRFVRRVEGRLPPLRVGWAMLRPRAGAAPGTAPE
jgi:4-amino-4-deoxy-L-arabinose transferase-like glycosyltransferase